MSRRLKGPAFERRQNLIGMPVKPVPRETEVIRERCSLSSSVRVGGSRYEIESLSSSNDLLPNLPEVVLDPDGFREDGTIGKMLLLQLCNQTRRIITRGQVSSPFLPDGVGLYKVQLTFFAYEMIIVNYVLSPRLP